MLDSYQDIDEHSDFDHYFDNTVITSNSQQESENSIINNNYVNSHGQPTCKQGENAHLWINKHNERYDGTHGVHYHQFLITKANSSTKDDRVTIRLFHQTPYFHTVQDKLSSEYCLDNAYKLENATDKNSYSYFGTIAKICHKEIEQELKISTGVRICCESSKGGTQSECGETDPDKTIETIGRICYSDPDNHQTISFFNFVSESFSSELHLPIRENIRYLYGMPECPTHDYNLSKYRWSILQNGYLMLGNSIYNHTNYCINYGKNYYNGKNDNSNCESI